MAHEVVYGFCENKCKVEVAPKTETDAFDSRITALETDVSALEGVSNGGNIKSASITNSGTITSTGLITANGGVTGNLTGFVFVKGTVGTSGDENYATCNAQTITISTSQTTSSSYNSTYINGYSIISLPKRHTWGVYTRKSDLTGTLSPSISSRTLIFKLTVAKSSSSTYFVPSGYVIKYKKSTDSSWSQVMASGSTEQLQAGKVYTYSSITVTPGVTYYFYLDNTGDPFKEGYFTVSGTVSAGTTYKINYAKP